MEKIVISIGGSILVPDKADTKYILALANLLKKLSKECKLFVVVGGGKIARYYISLGRKLGADESYLDEMGIEVTRLNARLLITALGDLAYHIPAETFDEALAASKTHKIVVMGGTHSGHTTDAVAAMLAERIRADRIINATSVDGIYTSDPRKDRKAKKIDRMNFQDLIELTLKIKEQAGLSIIFDPLGTKLINRSKIPLLVLHGRDLNSLANAIKGKRFKGTVVS